VGNDGGPKHVASAAGVPTITVFRWQIWPVWTDTARPGLHQAVDAPPPGGCDMRCVRCRHRACLAAVEPERVLNLALRQLGDRPGESWLVQIGS
jgi:ADP-heptose:LPS heptosyltransferase